MSIKQQILDHENQPHIPATKHKKWAFKIFIYYLIVKAIYYYKLFNYPIDFSNPTAYSEYLGLFNTLSFVLTAIGLALLALSHKNKETKNYQFIIPMICFSLAVTSAFLRSFSILL